MDIRLGWIAAVGAFLLVLARMSTLLTAGAGSVGWTLILTASFVLGAAGSIGALLAGARLWLVVAVALIGSALALARTAAGSTLILGVIPTGETLAAVSEEMPKALELIRFGAPPVLAIAGLIAVLASVFWILGGIVGFGSSKRRPMLMAIPLIAFYLILATLDRNPPNWYWPAGLALIAALAMLAGRVRRATGRARSIDSGNVIRPTGRGLPAAVVTLVVATAILSTSSLAAVVPESGLVTWRNASGFSGLFGGFSINLFTSMQQDLVGNNATVAFVAKVSEPAPPNADLYWKLITLDAFDGEFWLPGDLRLGRPLGEVGWEADEFRFRGSTVLVNQNIEIYALRQNFLPLLYSPVALTTEDVVLADSYRAREDGSINFDTRTSQNLGYSVTSRVPVPDLASLATDDGQLSPIFARAVEDGVIRLAPTAGAPPTVPARSLERYTELPDNLGPEIAALAATETQFGSTPFEKVLLLESFFRFRNFVYDATASTGHTSLDLTEWLTVPESLNHRKGYCEQFATAMAVMARTLDIPSRVVLGFAPGDVQPQPDGSDLIVVRALHGHAWVEVFLPSQGWVRFDPTPRGDEINPSFVEGVGFEPADYLPAPGTPVPGQNVPTSPPALPPGFEDPGVDPGLGLPGAGLAGVPLTAWLTSLGLVTILMAIIPTLKALRRRRRLARLKHGDIGAAWAEITDRLADLGYQLDPSRTPRETAISIDRALLPLAFRLSADVYGERIAEDREAVFHDAEARIRRDLNRWQWWWASVQPRSLIRSTARGRISDRLPAIPR